MKSFKFLSMTLAALALTALIGCASSSNKSSTGEYIDDTVITTKVKAALVDDPTLKATEINVETFKGVVQLSGFVKTESEIARAVSLARNIEGVKSVKNDIQLK